MPTYIVTRAFHSDLGRLTREQRQRLWTALYAFIDDLLAMEAGEINQQVSPRSSREEGAGNARLVRDVLGA